MAKRLPLLLALFFASSIFLHAGGPLLVSGPGDGQQGQPLLWRSSPVAYRVDGGPMSQFGSTVRVSQAAGVARVDAMFRAWQDVPTSSIAYSNAGSVGIPGSTDTDVNTLPEFNLVAGECDAGGQSPVFFDADGAILRALGADNAVIGFAGICKLDPSTNGILSALLLLNGTWQDGVDSGGNFEMTAAEFDEAAAHEIGHFSGLDHSQVNVEIFWSGWNPCPTDLLSGLPLMFPFALCQARATAGMPLLAADDVAWISRLYPSGGFATQYGTIRGLILFSDGITQTQGVNVIARRTDDPARIAVSVVSGYLFTGNPGQSVTATSLPCSPASACPPNGFLADNTEGSRFGSRDPLLIGRFEIPVPPGSYTVTAEAIFTAFVGGSSVGPLDTPILIPGGGFEYWNADESANDDPFLSSVADVTAGAVVEDINIILNNTPPRYDFIDQPNITRLFMPAALGRRREDAA